MSTQSLVARTHLILGRLGLAVTGFVWLALAVIDVIERGKSLGEAAGGVFVTLLWILLVAGPYVLYLRYTNSSVPTVLSGLMLNAVMVSLQLVAIFYKDGQAGLALIWAIVGGYFAVAVGVFLENFALGYREGEDTSDPSGGDR